jgi:hypothetical protein
MALVLVEFVVPHSDPLFAAIGVFAIYAAVLVAYPLRAGFETWASKAGCAPRDLIGRTRP